MSELTTRQRQHVEAQRASGASYAAYAAANQVNVHTLKGWAQQVRDEERDGGGLKRERGVTFARAVAVATPRAATLMVEVNGARVVVGEDFDERLLRKVISALRETGA